MRYLAIVVLFFLVNILLGASAQCSQPLKSGVINYTNKDIITHSGSFQTPTLNNNANTVKFAPDVETSAGIFLKSKVSLKSYFEANFQVKSYKTVAGNRSQGAAFLLQNVGPAERGGSNYHLGYNINKVIAVEFDTYSNKDLEYGADVPIPHMCIKFGVAGVNAKFDPSYCVQLNSGRSDEQTDITANLKISIARQNNNNYKVQATATCVSAAAYCKNGSHSVDISQDTMSKIFGSDLDAWVGFTSSSTDIPGKTDISNISYSSANVDALRCTFTGVNSFAANNAYVTSRDVTFQLVDACGRPYTSSTVETSPLNAPVTAQWLNSDNTVSTTGDVRLTNNGQGTYKVDIKETKAGSYKLQILVDGKKVPEKLFTVTHSSIDPTKSTYSFSTSANANKFVAGIGKEVTVSLFDTYGNPVSTQASVTARFGCCGDITLPYTSANKYTGQVMVTEASSNSILEFKVNAIQIKDSPMAISITPNIPHGPSCTMSGLGLTSAVVGDTTQYTIDLAIADEYSNPISEDVNAQHPVVLKAVSSTDSSVVLNRESAFSNGYKLIVKTTVSGNYQVTCTVAGKPCRNASNYVITVRAGDVDVSKTDITSTNATPQAGLTHLVDMVMFDKYKNRITSALSPHPTVLIDTLPIPCDNKVVTAPSADIESVLCNFHTSGKYTVQSIFKKAKSYPYLAKIADKTSPASYSAAVTHGLPSAADSSVTAPATSTADNPLKFNIQLKDKYLNNISTSAGLTVVVTTKSGSGFTFSPSNDVSITGSNGAFVQTITLITAAQDYDFTWNLAGALLKNLELEVSPGVWASATSEFAGSKHYSVGSDNNANVAVLYLMKDKNKNIIGALPEGDFKFAYTSNPSTPTPATCTSDAINGSFINGYLSASVSISSPVPSQSQFATFVLCHNDAIASKTPFEVEVLNNAIEHFGTFEPQGANYKDTVTDADIKMDFTSVVITPEQSSKFVFIDRKKVGNGYKMYATGDPQTILTSSIILRFYSTNNVNQPINTGIQVNPGVADPQKPWIKNLEVFGTVPGIYYAKVVADNVVTKHFLPEDKFLKFEVLPGAFSAQSSFSLAETVVGVNTITITPRDILNNVLRDLDASKMTIQVGLNNNELVDLKVTPKPKDNNKNIVFEFTLETSGNYKFVISHADSSEKYEQSVTLIHSEPSTATPDGQTVCYANEPCSLTLALTDVYGNDITDNTGLSFLIKYDGKEYPTVWSISNSFTFTFTYTISAGVSNVRLLYGASKKDIGGVKDANMLHAILPNAGKSSTNLVAGNKVTPGELSFTLTTKDEFGNDWFGVNGDYVVTLYEGKYEGETPSTVIATIPADGKFISTNVLTVRYNVKTVGEYYWDVTIKGAPMKTLVSVKPFTVIPGDIAPRSTLLETPTVTSYIVDNFHSVTLTMRDAHMNVVTDATKLTDVRVTAVIFEGSFVCTAQGSNENDRVPTPASGSSLVTQLFVTKQEKDASDNGKVTFFFKTNTANTIDVNGESKSYYYLIYVDNMIISSCGSSINYVTYTHGPISPAHTKLGGITYDALEAGSFDKFILTYADKFGNPVVKTTTTSVSTKLFAGCTDGTNGNNDPDIETTDDIEDEDLLYKTSEISFAKSNSINTAGVVKLRITVNVGDGDENIIVDGNPCFAMNVFPTYPDVWEIYNNGEETAQKYIDNDPGSIVFKSGIRQLVRIRSIDQYENTIDYIEYPGVVNANDYNYTITARYKSTNPLVDGVAIDYVVSALAIPNSGRGLAANITLDWPGKYDVAITIVEKAVGRTRKAASIDAILDVVSSVCPSETPYYENGKCVASYSKAPFMCRTDETSNDINHMFSEVTDISKCKCHRSQTRCPSDETHVPFYCIDAASKCPSAIMPTPFAARRACPPNFFLCEDMNTCVEFAQQCPKFTPIKCDGGYTCSDNTCVEDVADCPSQVVCPMDKPVLCPDNLCYESNKSCTAPRECNEPNKWKCPDGSCTSDIKACPSNVVCSAGTFLCPNGSCAKTMAECGETLDCPLGKYRCPDGSCANDIIFCPIRPFCPAGTLLCSNKKVCVTSADKCNVKQTCSGDRPHTCPSGDCVATFEQCPTSISCPVNFPVKCVDNTCVATANDCIGLDLNDCPPSDPFKCGDGTCKKSYASCSTPITCPSSRPVLCLDGSCVSSIQKCPALSTVQDVYECPTNFIRCSSGICAPSVASCPTVRTCLPHETRCLDGICRPNCNIASAHTCAPNLIQCPMINAGIVCRSRVTDCPQDIVCPLDKPVRCIDATCASSAAECPFVDSELITSTRIPCAGGNWAVTQEICATTTTCPKDTPVKCWDESCRISTEDCPVQRSCTVDKPFRCSDGSCALNAWGCSISRCADPAAPIRCPSHDSSTRCVNDISKCPNVLDLDAVITNKCAHGQRCWDGSCVSELRYCPQRTCPLHTPFLCRSGKCALNDKGCNNEKNDCPAHKPHLCVNTGECMVNEKVCPKEAPTPCLEGKVRCEDGTCRTENQCNRIGPNGCPITSPIRCHDGQCVSEPTNIGSDTVLQCLTLSDNYNSCPASRPVRCPGGFCASTKSSCPKPSFEPNEVCETIPNGPPKRVRCDNGSCAYTLAECPVIKPCSSLEYRCPDGTCSPFGCDPLDKNCRNDLTSAFHSPFHGATCSGKTTCPANKPYMCQNGLCASSSKQCSDNYPLTLPRCCKDGYASVPAFDDESFDTCALETTANCMNPVRVGLSNCPTGTTTCDSGACVSDASHCDVYDFKNAGCPADVPERCSNGHCAVNATSCLTENGCPLDARYLSDEGVCVSDPALVTTAQVTCPDTHIMCPNGHCAESSDKCKLHNQCSIDTPYLCADGTCAKHLASPVGSSDAKFVYPADTCKPTVVCGATKPFACADGSCATFANLCPSVLPCSGKCEFRCPLTQKCVSLAEADGTCDPTSAALSSKCGAPSSCPASASFLCPDGACRNSLAECVDPVTNKAKTTSCPKNHMRCWHGGCALNSFDCLTSTADIYHFNTTITSSTLIVTNTTVVPSNVCPGNKVPCFNGACVKSITQCPVVPACPHNHIKCADGSCIEVKDATTTPTCPTVPACPAGSERCVDGLCREKGFCPAYSGCLADKNPFTCAFKKVQCVKNYAECHGTPNTAPMEVLFDFAVTNTTDEITGQEVCMTNCERDISAHDHTVLVHSSYDTQIVVSVNKDAIPRTVLSIPAGSFTNDTEVTINSVPTFLFDGSTSNNGINLPFEFKRAKRMNGAAGDYASKVISTPFHCSSAVNKPGLPMTVSAYADTISYDTNDGSDLGDTDMPCDLHGAYSAVSTLTPDPVQPDIICPYSLNIDKQTITIAADPSDPAPSNDCNLYHLEGTYDPERSYNLTFNNDGRYEIEISETYSKRFVCFNVTKSDRTLFDDMTPPVNGTYHYVPFVGTNMCVYFERIAEMAFIGFPQSFTNSNSSLTDIQTPPFNIDSNTLKGIRLSVEGDPCAEAAAANSGVIPTQDMCLGYYTNDGKWECLYNREERLATPVWSPGMGLNQVSGVIHNCDVNAYAFLHSPLPPYVEEQESFCWICEYWWIIVIVVVAFGLIVLIGIALVLKFLRDRQKFKEEQAKLKQLQERAKELDEYAGGLGWGDDEMAMTANPCVIQLQDLQKQLDEANQKMDNTARQEEHDIANLEMQRQAIRAEMQRVEDELKKQQSTNTGPSRVDGAGAGPTAVAAAPASRPVGAQPAPRQDGATLTGPTRAPKKN